MVYARDIRLGLGACWMLLFRFSLTVWWAIWDDSVYPFWSKWFRLRPSSCKRREDILTREIVARILKRESAAIAAIPSVGRARNTAGSFSKENAILLAGLLCRTYPIDRAADFDKRFEFNADRVIRAWTGTIGYRLWTRYGLSRTIRSIDVYVSCAADDGNNNWLILK